jgi:hypothetical protein
MFRPIQFNANRRMFSSKVNPKVKIFHVGGFNPDQQLNNLENTINKWISDRPNIEILDFKFQNVSDTNCSITNYTTLLCYKEHP